MGQGVRGVEFVLGDLLRLAGGDEEEVDSMVGCGDGGDGCDGGDGSCDDDHDGGDEYDADDIRTSNPSSCLRCGVPSRPTPLQRAWAGAVSVRPP